MTRYLKLENITGRFNVPCVMDIKIGKVTWDDDVDDKFKETRRKKIDILIYKKTKSKYLPPSRNFL